MYYPRVKNDFNPCVIYKYDVVLRKDIELTEKGDWYVQLAPTTYFRAPDCYGNYNTQCSNLCPVRRQCETGKEKVWKTPMHQNTSES